MRDDDRIIAGTVIGGVTGGLIGGPIGVIVGGVAGVLLAEYFNIKKGEKK